MGSAGRAWSEQGRAARGEGRSVCASPGWVAAGWTEQLPPRSADQAGEPPQGPWAWPILVGTLAGLNVACAAKFSSDRTIRQYAKEIWHIEPTKF